MQPNIINKIDCNKKYIDSFNKFQEKEKEKEKRYTNLLSLLN